GDFAMPSCPTCSTVSRFTGLRRNAIAPACNARRSSASLARPVRKTIGMCMPLSARRRCSSRPSIPGIRTSRMRHRVTAARPEARKASAESKASAWKPKEWISRRVDWPTEASSSTIETRRSSAPAVPPTASPSPVSIHGLSVATGAAGRLAVRWDRRSSARSAQVPPSALGGHAELGRHPDERGERLGAHLLHVVGAVELDCPLGRGELAGDLLVEEPGDDQRQDLALARGELLVALPQGASLVALGM